MVSLSERQHGVLGALYPLLIVLVLLPFADVLLAIAPARPAEPGWRFGVVGVLLASLPSLAFAITLLAGLTTLLGHHRAQLAVGVVAVLMAIVVGLASLSFGLDALEVRRLVRADAKPGFDDSAFRALITVALVAPTMLWVGVRTISAARAAAKASDSDGPAPLLVGQA
jgi:hypothetical protein